MRERERRRVVRYQSGELSLRGYLEMPEHGDLRSAHGVPVLVYLHGGFALGASDVRDCRPFLDAGFAVFAPAFRGENGNPGHHELFWGELDDARAAIARVRSIPGLDAERVVVMGHSAGGVLSLMLALTRDVPVLDTGSAGGFYDERIFDELPVPFVDSPDDRRLRTPLHWVGELVRPHYACIGDSDTWPLEVSQRAQTLASERGAPLDVEVVPGNHHSSLRGCMRSFLERVLPAVRSPAETAARP